MGRRKRKVGRCVKRNKNVLQEPEELVQAPHSFVIHRGLPGDHILELTKDFRKVMEPFTAKALKERKKNAIKDFVSVAGFLHVTHLCIFSRTEIGMYLKICRLPRGPTLTFKIHNFTLARDVISSLKKQLVFDSAFKHSPLIILNSFSGEGMQLKLMASTFQNMFPTINLTKVDLNDIRRCVLVNYNPDTKLLDFRHYAIKVAPVGISKGVKKVVQGKVPNLGNCNDISEFFTKSGILSESEYEDDPTNHITLSQKMISRGNVEQGKSSIRLSEIGPRLTLQLIKIEDGLLDGEVLYHDLIHKSEEEKAEIQKKRELKRKLKMKLKKVQEENLNKKEEQKEEHKKKCLDGIHKRKSESEIIMRKLAKENVEENKTQDDNDIEYYKEEVGEEPDQDLFAKKQAGIKRLRTPFSYKNKKPRLDSDMNKKEFNNKKKPKTDQVNVKKRDYRPIGGSFKPNKKVISSKIKRKGKKR